MPGAESSSDQSATWLTRVPSGEVDGALDGAVGVALGRAGSITDRAGAEHGVLVAVVEQLQAPQERLRSPCQAPALGAHARLPQTQHRASERPRRPQNLSCAMLRSPTGGDRGVPTLAVLGDKVGKYGSAQDDRQPPFIWRCRSHSGSQAPGHRALTSTLYCSKSASKPLRWFSATYWSPSLSPAVAGATELPNVGSGSPVKSVVSA